MQLEPVSVLGCIGGSLGNPELNHYRILFAVSGAFVVW